MICEWCRHELPHNAIDGCLENGPGGWEMGPCYCKYGLGQK